MRLIDGGQQLHVSPSIALWKAMAPVTNGLHRAAGLIAANQACLPGPGSGRSSSPGSAATSRAPCGFAWGTAAGIDLLYPVINVLAAFAFEPDLSLRWLLETPRSDPGSASLLRARWLSILSMPRAPGSSCIGNCILLQAHLAVEETWKRLAIDNLEPVKYNN